MSPEAIGSALIDFFETIDKQHFVSTQKDFILEYVAKNAENVLDYNLGEYLPVMIHFWNLLLDIAEDEKREKKEQEQKQKQKKKGK